MPTLNPVGHQSTNWTVRLVLMVAIAALTSLDYVSTIQHAASHVLAMARVAFDHLVGWLEAGIGDFSHAQLLVIGFFCRDDRGIRDEGQVDTRVRHQVGLELGQIYV